MEHKNNKDLCEEELIRLHDLIMSDNEVVRKWAMDRITYLQEVFFSPVSIDLPNQTIKNNVNGFFR